MKEPKTEQLEAIMDELTDQDMALAFSGGVDSSAPKNGRGPCRQEGDKSVGGDL